MTRKTPSHRCLYDNRILGEAVMDYGKINPPEGWTKESCICPKCGGPLEDLSGVAVSVKQYREEVGKCFVFFDGKTIECQAGTTAQ